MAWSFPAETSFFNLSGPNVSAHNFQSVIPTENISKDPGLVSTSTGEVENTPFTPVCWSVRNVMEGFPQCFPQNFHILRQVS
jgi:hypothetical protein